MNPSTNQDTSAAAPADPMDSMNHARSDDKAVKQRGLRRMKRFSLALLAVAAALFVTAHLHHEAGAWAWLAAFSEAAMVGALADWFAVVALFRKPLGLPIPHTGILPENKARVADNLGAFVRDKFFGADAVVARIDSYDPASRIAAWLTAPENAALIADKAVTAAARMLQLIDDEPIRAMLYAAVRHRAQRFDLASGAGALLATLTDDNRHQRMLDQGLQELSGWLAREDIQQMLADKIVEVASDEYPKLIGTLGFIGLKTDDLGRRFAAGLVRGARKWLEDIGDDPHHERRQAFDRMVREFIERLRSDPEFRSRIEQHKLEWIERPALRDYVDGLWRELTAWLQADLARNDSTLRRRASAGITLLAKTLADSDNLRDSLNRYLRDAARALAPQWGESIARHIAMTVRQWDDETLVRDVELSIGRDLQFIRVNGTLVGGLVGLAIHGLSILLG